MKKYIAFLIIIFTAVQLLGQNENTVSDRIAGAYGIDSFSKVKSIHYVFHVQKGEKNVQREWIWFPAEKNVIAGSGENAVKYNRDSFDRKDEKLSKIDRQFINDNYWLLFPFRLAWDKGVKVVEKGKAKAPVSGGILLQVNVEYDGGDGYTPNDIYELYLNDNFEIVEWVYRPGGNGKINKPASWSEPEEFNGIKISLSHQNKDGSFRLWFTDLDVKLK